jgi:hypothetical protein
MKSQSTCVMCLAVAGLFMKTSSAWAECTAFGGLWDDQDYRVWLVSQSGQNFTGTLTTGCGDLSFSGDVGSGGSGVINLVIPENCIGPGYYTSAYAPSTEWSTNCDRVRLTFQDYDPQGQLLGGPYYSDSISYATGEVTSTSVVFPDWVNANYIWRATATTSANGRSFQGRSFFEADNTGSPDDNCWWSGLPVSLRYDSLNKGGGGPYPNINNWLPLDGASAWNDRVGWGDLYWVTYYRQNSPTFMANASCSASVRQIVNMVADWGGGLWGYRAYKQNSHVITIWNANGDTAYVAGRQGSDDWHIGSVRDLQVRKKFWPVLDSPTNLAFASVTATSIQITWTSSAGDGDGFNIWRSTNGVNYVDYAVSSTTSYTDTAVTSGQQYFYYVRARLSPANGNAGATLPVTGPPSDPISTTTP